MKVKILGNVDHNGVSLVGGDVVEMPESQAKQLIAVKAAEVTTLKVTKKAEPKKHKKLGEEVAKLREAKKTKK